MSEERELKFKVEEHEPLRARLRDQGAAEIAGAGPEENWVFDRGDELREGGRLLRLRADGHGVRLTFKGPVRWDGNLKVRDEHEVRVGDAEVTRRILESLGYVVVRRYEKVREEWRIGGTIVALDETPIGQFVEFEGPDAEVAARRFGFEPAEAESRTYLRLWEDYRKEHPGSPAEMVFS